MNLEDLLTFSWLLSSGGTLLYMFAMTVSSGRTFRQSTQFSILCYIVPSLLYLIYFLALFLRTFIMYDPGVVFFVMMLVSPVFLVISTLFSVVHLSAVGSTGNRLTDLLPVFANAGSLVLVLGLLFGSGLH